MDSKLRAMLPVISLDLFDAAIFDLGGVILELHPEETVRQLTTLVGRDASMLYTQVNQVPLFDQYERGEITSAAFRAEVLRLAGASTPVSDDDFDRAWNAMLSPIPSAHLDFLAALLSKKRTFLLSNTNEIHVAQFLADYARDHGTRRPPFEEHFEGVHYSHDLHFRKPETRAYLTLAERHGLSPERTLFIDDNRDNVSAAARAGFVAFHHPTNAPLPARFSGLDS